MAHEQRMTRRLHRTLIVYGEREARRRAQEASQVKPAPQLDQVTAFQVAWMEAGFGLFNMFVASGMDLMNRVNK